MESLERIQRVAEILEAARWPKQFVIAPQPEYVQGMVQTKDIYIPKAICFLEEHLH